MNEILSISIDVTSGVLSLSEISETLQISPSATSHEKGSKRGSANMWSETIFRYEVQLISGETLTTVLVKTFMLLTDNLFFERVKLIKEQAEVVLDIAYAVSDASCSILIPAEILASVAAAGMNLEVTCYVTGD